jgi:hypothetical protein
VAKSFQAQINDWVSQTNQRIESVFKSSAQDVIELMQTPVAKGGNLPVDTGFLRASLQVNLIGPVATIKDNLFTTPNSAPDWNSSDLTLSLVNFDIGKTIWATYGANYAAHVHYGANGRVGRQFVTLAAQKWVSIVNRNAAALKASVAARQ